MSTDEERSKDPFFFQLAVRPSPPPLPPQMFYAGPPPPPLYSYAPPPIGGRPSFLPTSEGGPFRFPTHPIARDVGHHFQLADPPPGPNTAPDFPVFYDPPMRRDRVSSTGTGRRLSAARRAETNPDAELREEKRRRNAESSQRHREKQRTRLVYLEGRVAELERELERARAAGNAEVRDEVIAKLQEENYELRRQSREDSSSGKEGSPSSTLSLNSPPLDLRLPTPYSFGAHPPHASSSSSSSSSLQPYSLFSTESRLHLSTVPQLLPSGSTLPPTDCSLDDESDPHRL